MNSRLHGQVDDQENGKELKNRKDKNNPSKKVTNLLDGIKRVLRNAFGNSGSCSQKVYCIHNKGTQIFCSDLSMSCTSKKGSTIRSLREIYKIIPPFKFRCSYEWRKGGRGFRSGCKLCIMQVLKIAWFGFVYIQKRHLNNLSSQPIVPENLLFFPKDVVCDWFLKQLLSYDPTNNIEFLSVNVLQ